MPKWAALLIEYFVTAWRDTYEAAKRFISWIQYDFSKKIKKISKKSKDAEKRLDERLNGSRDNSKR